MLELDPSKRITAKEALEHEYFKVEPLQCKPEEYDWNLIHRLPRLEKDSHEFQSRQDRQNKQKMQQQKGNNINKADQMVGKQQYPIKKQDNRDYSSNISSNLLQLVGDEKNETYLGRKRQHDPDDEKNGNNQPRKMSRGDFTP
jgi:serine/threonine protein kinase